MNKEKKQKSDINFKRKALREFYTKNQFQFRKTLEAIEEKATNNPTHIFDDLYRILHEEDTLYQAMGNISKKSGALTPGPPQDQQTVDAMSKEKITEIAKELKQGIFKFKPIRRIYIEKSPQNPATKKKLKLIKKLHKIGPVTPDQIKDLKLRPLGIPSFKDKIVQESIRMILNAIYEPEFKNLNLNFGFRPKLGCLNAIDQIKNKAKSMDFAIEGDIKGAFDNVNHEILINILRKKIKDNKFLRLINGGLKCGLIYLTSTQETPIGTTQGSIVSPLLYNIYFNEFDKFIHNDFQLYINKLNQQENRKDIRLPTAYQRVSKLKFKSPFNKLQKRLINEYQENKENNTLTQYFKTKEYLQLITQLRIERTKFKKLDELQKKIPSRTKSQQTIRFTYVRYADDWIFYTNADIERTLEWKNLFAKWINDNLKLNLSLEKTKITDLKKGEHAHFLGFQLRSQGKNRKVNKVGVFKTRYLDPARRSKKVKTLNLDTDTKKFKMRATNPAQIVAWDRTRVLSKLETNGFITKIGNTWRGRSKLPWTSLTEPEIIERFNYIIRGYLNYYTPVCDYPTDTHFLHYLLTYSCAHTLAQKLNCKLSNIFKKFGKNITIKYIAKTITLEKGGSKNEKSQERTISLLNWKECLTIIRSIIIERNKSKKASLNENKIQVDEIPKIKINWRTKYKLSKHCAICGSTEKIEYHHVKHIKKGKVEGFLQILNQLNRKQIPCCQQCHRNIHKGKYDGIALQDIYDEELIII
jgi:retron-type reverse transcriptase